MSERSVTFTVNGEVVTLGLGPRRHLGDVLREELGLTGTHLGCEHGVCGACTVRLDGVIVRSCLTLAVQCEGSRIETIEGLSDTGEVLDLQDAFRIRNALQCGFCTPGMIVTAQDLLLANPEPTRDEIREHISGNYCRCTGYHAIVDAIESTAKARRQPADNAAGKTAEAVGAANHPAAA
jgi:carbon-monoxide dehydrogenase small subunit